MSIEEENYFEDHELADVVKRFEKMLMHNERRYFDVIEYEDIVEYYLDLRKFDQALGAIKIGLIQHPNSQTLKQKQAQVFIENGQPIKALKIINKLQLSIPASNELLMLKGTAYCNIGQVQEAIRHYNQALDKTFEEKDEILYTIALSFEQINQYKIATKYLQQAHDINPKNLSVIYDLAYCYERSAQYDKSIKYYKLYLDKNPFSENVWYNLGIIYNSLGDYHEAISAYDFAIAINQKYSSAYYNKANSLVNLEEYEKAIKAFKNFLEYEEDNDDAYSNIGECYEKLNKYDDALYYYRKALKLNNLNPDAWFGMGVVFFYKDQYKESVQYIRKAIGFDDENSEYWYVLGNVYRAINNTNAAIKAYQFAVEIDPFDYEAWLNYSEVFYRNDNLIKAIQILNEAYNDNDGVALINYRLAAYHFLNKNTSQGFKFLEKGLKIDPEGYWAFIRYHPDTPKIRKLIDKYNK